MDPKVWLRNEFSEYYKKHTAESPPMINRREFGVGIEKKIDYRHLAFNDDNALSTYLRINTPLYISYSAAYYEFPGATPMIAKNLLGADLIFDFDLGDVMSDVPKLPRPDDLDLVKNEVIKLIEDFLIPDFGFSRDEILVFFSGSKGYHIHIRSDVVQDMDQRSRMEIVDYVSGIMNPRFFVKVIGKSIRGPTPSMGGWHGRIARELLDVLSLDSPVEMSRRLGVGLSIINRLIERKEQVVAGIKSGVWDQAPVSKNTWYSILQSIVAGKGVKLDRNVTIDMARLIRLPTSLHGDSGLIVARVRNLETFKPLDDTIVFGRDYVTVNVPNDINVYLGGDQEIRRGEQELPEYLAVYLVAKGGAIPVDGS